jgi:methionyl-tRNA formyltransferase
MARVVFMGTPDFAVPVLERLISDGHEATVVTQPDRPAGRGRSLMMSPVKRLALDHGLTVFQPETVNTPEFEARLRELRPEVGVVAAFGQLLAPRVLQIPAHGYLNVHASLLPRWRGASPITAAILADDAETGVTIMLVDEGLDTGPVLAPMTCEIHPDDTAATLEEKLSTLGADLMSRTLPGWMAGEITPRSQDDHLATLAGRVTKSDGRVNWTQTAERMWRMSRAYDPWPGLFAFLGDRRVRLWKVRPIFDWQGKERPGDVLAEYDEELVVATGKGALVLEEIQLAGKKRAAGADFRRGQRDLTSFS